MTDIPNKNEVTRKVDTGTNPGNPGPYIARVIEHLDSLYLGGLRVELLKTAEAGNIGETVGQTVEVYYASPFYGVTNSQNGPRKNDDYASTQKSYGFWAIPPDPGSLVLVTFVEGSRDFGYWFACIPEKGMTFMLPGGQPATEQLSGDIPTNLKGKKLPAGEYNKAITKPQTNNIIKYKKPINSEFVDALIEQGLVEDEIRGTTTSSAQRETPSAVVGFSSPGPLDKRGGKPTAPVGLKESKANIPVSRLGSSSIVIDDGDDKRIRKGNPRETGYAYVNKEASESGGDVTIPHNELIRLRTRTGAQILMHTSEDLIYINNSKGTCWIEMTGNGKLDVYAEDSISFHSDADINMKAERDINIHASRNLNFTSNESTFMSSAENWEVKVGIDGKITTETKMHINVGEDLAVQTVGSQDYKIGKDLKVESAGLHDIKVGQDLKVTTEGAQNFNAKTDVKLQAAETMNLKSKTHQETADQIHMNSGGNPAKTADEAAEALEAEKAKPSAVPKRIPEHEPWQGHESLNPTEVTVDKTEAEKVEE